MFLPLLSITILVAFVSLCQCQTRGRGQGARSINQSQESTNSDDWYLGKEMSISSKILGEDRLFRIGLPKSYGTRAQSYPVVYVLDGEAYYFAAAGAIRALSSLSMMPEVILVAVYNPARQYDLTPPDMNIPSVVRKRGDRFLQFMDEELIPFIDEEYRTLPLRVLFGHSHGGILGLYALTRSPELFQFHIALDAPVHLDKGYLEKGLRDMLVSRPDHAGRLCVGWNRYAWSKEQEGFLSKSGSDYFSISEIHLDGETHSSMYYPGLYQGLKALFSDHEYKHTKTLSFEELELRYRSMNAAYGYDIPIPVWALRYGALDHLVAADAEAARPFVEALEKLYQSSDIMDDDGRAWLNELESNPPKETRAQFLARADASADEAKPYFGTWRGGSYEIEIREFDGQVSGIITQTFPGGEQQIVQASKIMIMEDGALNLIYENRMPPRTGLLYFQLSPTQDGQAELEQGFRVYWPRMANRNQPQFIQMKRH